MPPLILNPAPPPHCAAALLSPSHIHHADAVVSVGLRTFPAHRAVLALHSTHFHDTAFSSPPPLRVALYHPSLSDEALAAGWALIYDYLYEVTTPITAPFDALAALHVADVWRFDELADILQSYILSHIHPTNCVSIYVAATPPSHIPSHPQPAPLPLPPLSPRIAAVRAACTATIKSDFPAVTDWGSLDASTFAKFLKLNDLGGSPHHTELAVFAAVSSWAFERSALPSSAPSPSPAGASRDPHEGATNDDGDDNDDNDDDDDERGPPPPQRAAATAAQMMRVPSAEVEALVKLVRFPTMPSSASAAVASAPLAAHYPLVRKYAAQIGRAPRFHITVETSPLFRPRRSRALTFADRVTSFSRVDGRMQTSARYFAGVLWHLVVGKRDGFVELYLGVMAEEPGAEVRVELDFTLYIAQMVAGAGAGEMPPMVRKEVKRKLFSRNGERIGFARVIAVEDVPDFARNDTLCIGASLRLRGCREVVEAIDDLVDHSEDAVVVS